MNARKEGTGFFEIDPRVDISDLFCKLQKSVDDGDVIGALVVDFRRDGRSIRYNLGLAGFAAAHPTHATGALAAVSLLMREIALKESGVLSS